MLRGFSDADGRLTVVHLRPEPRVERRKHPRRVGRVDRLNSWKLEDGTFDDELERVPMNRLDNVGADGQRDLIEFAAGVEPAGELRLLDRDWEDRVPLTLHVAGLMVRGPTLREKLDARALPSLIEHMRAGLLRAVAEGRTTEENVRPLLLAFDRPGMVRLDPARNRHQAILLDLIQTVTAAIGSSHIVATRRLDHPLLTGSEPVVVFDKFDLAGGMTCGDLLAAADPPVALWDEREAVLARVTEILSSTAGLAWAADRYTVGLFVNPETADGGKLAYAFSELSSEGLAGLLNIQVTARSTWIAGPAGDPTLEVFAAAAEAAATKAA